MLKNLPIEFSKLDSTKNLSKWSWLCLYFQASKDTSQTQLRQYSESKCIGNMRQFLGEKTVCLRDSLMVESLKHKSDNTFTFLGWEREMSLTKSLLLKSFTFTVNWWLSMIKGSLWDRQTLTTEVCLETETVKLLFALRIMTKNKPIALDEPFLRNILDLLPMKVSTISMKMFGTNWLKEQWKIPKFLEMYLLAYLMIWSRKFLKLTLSKKNMETFQLGLLNQQTLKAMQWHSHLTF